VSAVSFLALDAGQTGIRTRLETGDVIEQSFVGLKTDRDLFPQLAAVITEALDGEGSEVIVSIGTTGLTADNNKPDILLALLPAQVTEVNVAHDSITGFLGSLGLAQGTVIAVGTGVVTLAVGPTTMTRVDGWGNLIGDAGSAFWIGRAGLEAGMKAYDGRIPQTSLIQLLEENFSHPEEAYIELQTDPNRVSRIASFAKHVTEHALSDDVAQSIVVSAGEELALSAVTAARTVGLLESSSPRFSWTGNVMKSDLLRETFLAAITQEVPGAVFTAPEGEPLDGVALIPNLGDDSPLRAGVLSARRS
jgi:N-acetylglucosamine kinase-like BadF-type ATPase